MGAPKEQFQNKLSELQVLSAPLELRKNESETRAPALEKLKQTVQTYKDLLSSQEEQYAHITPEVEQRQSALQRIGDKVKSTPKPAPPKEEEKKEADKMETDDSKSEDKPATDGETPAPADAPAAEASPASQSNDMDVD